MAADRGLRAEATSRPLARNDVATRALNTQNGLYVTLSNIGIERIQVTCSKNANTEMLEQWLSYVSKFGGERVLARKGNCAEAGVLLKIEQGMLYGPLPPLRYTVESVNPYGADAVLSVVQQVIQDVNARSGQL